MEDLSLGRSVSHEEALLRRMSEEHADRLRSRHVGQDVDYPYMDGPEDLRCVNRDYLLKLHAFLHKVDLFLQQKYTSVYFRTSDLYYGKAFGSYIWNATVTICCHLLHNKQCVFRTLMFTLYTFQMHVL